MKNIICIFAKPPLAGKTKSRLAKAIGPTAAAELSAAMLKDIITQSTAVSNAELFIAYPPQSNPDDFSTVHIPGINYIVQCGDNLGERMANTFQYFLNQKHADNVIIIGSDCITTSTEILKETFIQLTNIPIVIGPARDGGYVLIGQSIFTPEIFIDIDWGTSNVMQQTRTSLDSAQIKYHELSQTFDIDNHEDLIELKKFIKSNPRPFTKKLISATLLG